MTGSFEAWNAEVMDLLNLLETLAGKCRTLGPPPASSDIAGRVDALAAVWSKCNFTPLAPGFPVPWESKASLLADQLRRAPEDLLRSLFADVGNALAAAIKEVGTDSKRQFVSTVDMPFFTYPVPVVVERLDKSTAFREVSGRTRLERDDRLWAAVELFRLPAEHPLQVIKDGWLAGQQHKPCAILGPCTNSKPFPFVSVADVVRHTEAARGPQRYQETVEERRRVADEEERRRAWEASERGRLDRIEKELAGLKK